MSSFSLPRSAAAQRALAFVAMSAGVLLHLGFEWMADQGAVLRIMAFLGPLAFATGLALFLFPDVGEGEALARRQRWRAGAMLLGLLGAGIAGMWLLGERGFLP